MIALPRTLPGDSSESSGRKRRRRRRRPWLWWCERALPIMADTLPDHWSYGVCRDGRVFFINDQSRSTTWLHPRTGEPVNSGHMMRSDLPQGWEEGFTEEGASFFINHNQRTTTFRHPVTGEISPENIDFFLQEHPHPCMSKPESNQRPPSVASESSTAMTSSTVNPPSGAKGSRSNGKVHSFGKRDHAIKRDPNVPAVVRGWLYKQDSSGMRLWKRKWFVLADHCLFYYKDSREEAALGSIPLPSYAICPVEPADHISRKYAFKACHTGMRAYIRKDSGGGSQAEHSCMRTYFFSADTQQDMNGWIRAMNQAALVMDAPRERREGDKSEKRAETLERQAGPQTNHISSYGRSASQPEGLHRLESAERPDGAPFGTGKPEEGRKEREVGGQARSPAIVVDPGGLSTDSAAPKATPPVHVSRLSPGVRRSEPNGRTAYKRGVTPRPDTEKQVQRKSALAQVEHWVKVQKGDPRSLSPSEHTLPRRTPPTQPKAYQSLPKTSQHGPAGCSSPVPRNLPSDYKYAADRVSHLRMSADERVATKEGTVWQLYEWQQRQQFRHGSPTAPLYADASAFRITLEVPRSMSVPPSPSDIPPPGPTIKVLSPRRPHVPANRVTVRPVDEASAVGVPASVSPRHMYPQHSRTTPTDRRSVPPMGYMTHTVSAPSLHGKTADDTYLQLKSDLEYLDLKVMGREILKDKSARPVKVAESDVDVKLSRLCEQDKVLQELESRIRSLKEDKDKLESVLDVSHQQMEQYRDQPAHAEKIAYQQKLLQEDVVHIRAEMSRVSTEMEKAWNEYSRLESDLHQLRESLQDQMHRTILSQQEKAQMRKELWRMEDVMAGLSSSKAIYKVTVDSVKNPERKLVPSISAPSVPSLPASAPVGKTRSPLHSPHLSPTWPEPQSLPSQQPLHLTRMDSEVCVSHLPVPSWAEDDAPPRPPLPQLYSPEENPPAVPPLPKEASAIRHTSVRGLKRQSDERKRDREFGQYINGDYKVELRSYVSEPELFGQTDTETVAHGNGYQTLPSRGLAGSTSRLNQSTNISSFVTLRRGVSEISFKERPKSALERLYPGEAHHGGRMSAEEQLERMKRHQKALVRERKRNLSQSERQSTSSRASAATSSRTPPTDLGSWKREQDFDMQLLERAVQGAERPPEHQDNVRPQADEWLTVLAKPLAALDLEPVDFELDLQRELSTPQKVFIPQRATEPEEPLSQHDAEARYRKAERISGILAQSSSVQNMLPPEDPEKPGEPSASWVLQERMVAAPYVLASEASLRNKEVTAPSQVLHPPTLPSPAPQPPNPSLSNGFHYTFV
ncbi:pleckstrin homology domain-containing family A member 7-like isoform X4 [Scleropages formosus]|uniref:pleckstrin homology domain-containing family A member 7-like isoform X4 n=1 Tax=Scleropages formosus TaxID=113540 RepID=UPI0010FA8CBB|nr:pleckstrin homology domain-containing family A member 7-like isoform X4 [Scleropages formosus]